MTGAKGNHARDDWFQALRDESLQHMALDRQPHARHAHHLAGITGNCDADFLCADKPFRCLDTAAFAVLDAKAGDFAILDDIDAKTISRACIAPGHSVVPYGATAPLGKATLDWKPVIVKIQERTFGAHLLSRQQLCICAIQQHRIASAAIGIALAVGVDQIQDTALADHCIVIDVLFQPFPQL